MDAPQKKGLSPLAIVGIVLAVFLVLGLGTCGVAGYLAGEKLKDVTKEGGVVLQSPEAVAASLATDRQEYVGSWTSKSGLSKLVIHPEGTIAYTKAETGSKTTLTGPIAEFQGNDIVLKLAIEFRVKVSTPPHLLEKQKKWELIADNIVFFRDESNADQ